MSKNDRLTMIRNIVSRKTEEIGARTIGLVLVTQHDEREAFVEEFNHTLPKEIETEDEAIECFDSNRFSTDRKDNVTDCEE